MGDLLKPKTMYSNQDSNYALIKGNLFNPLVDKVNAMSNSDGAINMDTISEYTSGSGVTIDGVLLKDGAGTFTLGATGVVTIDADTTDHTGSNVLSIDSGVNSASVNVIYIDNAVKTALSAGEITTAININTDSLPSDADTSAVRGINILASGVATSAADLVGVRVAFDGTKNAGDSTKGFVINSSDLTINHASETFSGLEIDASGMTCTSGSALYGIDIAMPATNTITSAGLNIRGVATNGIAVTGGSSAQLAMTTSSAASGFTVTATTQTVNNLNSITTATAVTSASLMKALDVSMTASSASSVNMIETSRFSLTSAVQMGDWANALVGKLDLSTTGYVTGLAGSICGELDLPSTNPAGGSGSYTVFEGELNMPTGFTSTVPVSFLTLNAWGAGIANFDTYGYIMDITGVSVASGKVFQENTAGAATHALRIRVAGTPYYIMLTSTGA